MTALGDDDAARRRLYALLPGWRHQWVAALAPEEVLAELERLAEIENENRRRQRRARLRRLARREVADA